MRRPARPSIRTHLLVTFLVLAACGDGRSPERSEASTGAVSSTATQDWSLFPAWGQCLAAIQTFYPAKLGVRVPVARASWTADCAPEGACHIWLDDIPSAASWERIAHDGKRRPSPYDLVVYPPSASNPWGHVASVDHVDAYGNVYVMDANFAGDERKAATPHTVARAPYGWYHPRALPKRAGAIDFDGDGCEDVFGALPDGGLRRYSGACGAGFREENVPIGHGWNGLDLLVASPDFDGDGCMDVIGRRTSDEALLLYGGDCAGGWARERVVIGTSWGAFDALVAPGDMDGDGCADIVGRRPYDGRLALYSGDCAGGFKGEDATLGTQWNGVDAIVAPGDVNGDACADLLGRTGDGVLRLYAGGCDGTLEDGVVIGHGWDMHTMVFGRDFDGDGCGDVIARDTKGDLFLYRSTCGGALQAPQYLGYGWNAFAALF